MRTINEVVVDVLANPEAYTDAFPVSGPERALMAFDLETATLTMGGINELANGASLTPEMMEEVRRRMLSSTYSREPRGWNVWPPATVDFMRRMLEERSPLMSGTWSDGETRFVQDESHPRDRVTMVNLPLREDSVADRIRRGEWHGWTARPTVWQDEAREWAQHMASLTAIDDPSMGTAERADAVVDAEARLAVQNQPRPDHYRVSLGRCVCGFTSMFDGDMDHHVRGIVHDCDGVPRRWWLCECGASALCREVVTMRPGPVGGWSDHTPYPPTPITEHIYLCDACCQRRGIRG